MNNRVIKEIRKYYKLNDNISDEYIEKELKSSFGKAIVQLNEYIEKELKSSFGKAIVQLNTACVDFKKAMIEIGIRVKKE